MRFSEVSGVISLLLGIGHLSLVGASQQNPDECATTVTVTVTHPPCTTTNTAVISTYSCAPQPTGVIGGNENNGGGGGGGGGSHENGGSTGDNGGGNGVSSGGSGNMGGSPESGGSAAPNAGPGLYAGSESAPSTPFTTTVTALAPGHPAAMYCMPVVVAIASILFCL